MKILGFIKLSFFILLLSAFCKNEAWLIFAASVFDMPREASNSHPANSQQAWMATGNLNIGRHHHTATLLANGKVLVVGGYSRCSFATGCTTLDSAELYDPASGTWGLTGRLRTARSGHSAVRLLNGKVLIAGGGSTPNNADLYDPATGAWNATGNLNIGRYDSTATLLPNGKVLIAGGATVGSNGNATVLNTAELYDPATGVWSVTGNLNSPRLFQSATLLPNGKVLVAGGESNLTVSNVVRSAELYDPASGTWSLTGNLNAARQTHTATLLQNGKVLVSSGFVGNSVVVVAELYNPLIGTWSVTGSSGKTRETATLLPDGKVLATGSDGGEISTEIYNPATGTWNADANLTTKRNNHTVTLLPNGKVLTAGGTGDGENGLNSSELYDASTLVAAASTVSAASFRADVASEAIAAAFGTNLASSTVTATMLPLPTSLADVTVKVKDSLGTERDAPLFFASPGQINFLIPTGTVAGLANVAVTSSGLTLATGTAQIASVAPGLFTANANGQGIAAAVLFRLKPDGSQAYEPVARFDAGQNRFIAVPIDLGPEADQLFLLLFGTGLRGRSSLSAVMATIGGANAEVSFAGPQGDFAGLDQVNVRLPRILVGRGEVNIALIVDGKAANAVTVNIR